MSLHSSLRRSTSAGRHRNVLKREERLAKLTEEEKWSSDANSVFSLPKVRSIKLRVKKKPKKKTEEEAAGAEAAGGEAGGAAAAPAAAGAAPGKGAAGAKAAGEAKPKGGGEAKK